MPVQSLAVLFCGGAASPSYPLSQSLMALIALYLVILAFAIFGGRWSELSVSEKLLLPALLPGFYVSKIVWYSLRLSKLLVSRGAATRGIVVEVAAEQCIFHRGYRHLIAYDAPARYYVSCFSEKVERRVGDTLTVLYLPEAPEQAMLYSAYTNCFYKAVASQEERSA